MIVTGRRWCDFLVYTRYGIHLERIMFEQQRWLQLYVQLNILLLIKLLQC